MKSLFQNLSGRFLSFAVAVAGLAASPIAHAACTPPPSGIIAWWPGQGNGLDLIGGNNATVPAGVTYSNSEVGLGFSFDGSEFLVVSNQPAFNTTNALTIECWAYTRGHSVPQTWGQELVTKDAECSGARQYQLIVGDSQVQPGSPDFRGGIWLPGGLVNIDGATVVQTNTWYHVAMTYDGTVFKLYVNGVLDGQQTASGPIAINTEPVRLGGGSDSGCTPYNLNGLLDEPAIYNRALSSSEIVAIYNAGSAGKCTPPPVTLTGVPAISSFSPTSGSNGTVVVISGTNFSATAASNIVYFGSVTAPVSSASPTSLTVTVPPGALYAPLTVTVGGLTAYSAQFFKPTFPGTGASLTATSFATGFSLPAGNGPAGTAVGDLDGDGRPDLVVISVNDGMVWVYRNISTNHSLSSASFAAPVILSMGGNPNGVALADLDGDGRLDIVVSDNLNSHVSVFQNFCTPGVITTNSFGAAMNFPVGQQPTGIAAMDLNGDGLPDVVTANMGDSTISVLQNTGAPGGITSNTFAAHVDFPTGATPQSVAIGDLDGDGQPDIATENINGNSVSVLRNLGGGGITANSFAPHVDLTGVGGGEQVVMGDVDGDGKLDLLVTAYTAEAFSVFRNISTPGSLTTSSFAPRIDFPTGGRAHRVALGDFDGDGRLDITATTELPNQLLIFKNLSSPGIFTNTSLAAPVILPTGSNPNATCIADLDGDGQPDIFMEDGFGNDVMIYQNVMPFATAPVAPTITQQPTNLTVNVGSTATFIVGATGTAPLSYQWSFNHTNLLGATNALLSLPNVQLSQAGSYAVAVSNLIGSTNSTAAILTILTVPPTITAQPTNQTVQAGGTASFRATVAGTTPFVYQWTVNGLGIAGATNLALTITNVQSSQAGNYALSVTNAYGSTVSSNAALTVLLTLDHFAWSTIPSPQTVNQPFGAAITAKNTNGFTVTNFTGAASLQALFTSGTISNGGFETGTLSNWTQVSNSVGHFVIDNGTVAPPGGDPARAPFAGSYCALGEESGPSLFYMYQDILVPSGTTTILNWAQCVRNLYTSYTSSQAFQVRICDTSNNVLATAFTTSPGYPLLGGWVQTNYNLTAFAGTKVRVMFWVDSTSYYIDALVDSVSLQVQSNLSVTPTNTGNFINGVWTGNLTVLQPATNVVLVANDGSGHTGTSNPFNVVSPSSPPIITQQPTNLTVNVSNTAVFAVTVTGTAPLHYQWSFNHTNLLGATNAALTLPNVQLTQAGSYSVMVTNLLGFTNSSAALLTVVNPTPPSCDAPPSGIVAWWPGQGNANDIIGGNNGTPVGSVSYANGEVGQAFSFDGSDFLVTSDQPALNPTNAVTVECWAYTRGHSVPQTWAQHLVSKDSECGAIRQYLLSIGDSQIQSGSPDFNGTVWLPGGPVSINGATVIQTNTWYHVAMTYDGTVAKLFVNGVLDGQLAGSGPIAVSTEPVRLGGGSPSGCLQYNLNGLLDEPAIYNRALSSNEIAAIYQAGSAGKCQPALLAPVITQQPTNLTVTVSNTAVFTVTATGTAPLSYQWSFNHTNLLGATNTTLTLPNVQLSQAGSYSVMVTNLLGFTNSSAALLTVVGPPPSCDSAPAGIVAWWPGQGSASDIIGGNNGTLMNGAGFAGGEVGTAFNLAGGQYLVANPATPSSLDVGQGSGLTFEEWIKPTTVTAEELLFEYERVLGTYDGSDVGVTLSIHADSGGILFGNVLDTGEAPHNIFTPPGLLVPNVWQHVALTYDKASGIAAFYINGASVTVSNLGSFTPQTSFTNFLMGARTTFNSVGNPGAQYSGLVDEVSLYNRALSSNEVAAIYNAGSAGKCTPALLAPVITAQPTNLTVNVSNTAMFAVTATGTAPLSYHWSFNHTNLLGATNATLTLPNVQLSQAGSYSVMITNLAGSTNSSAAILTVNPSLPSTVPVISSFSPGAAGLSNAVTITGLNFSSVLGNNIVYFGGVRANVSAASPTNLVVSVPAGATYAPITVTVNGLTAFAPAPFLPTFQGGASLSSVSLDTPAIIGAGNSPGCLAVGDLDGDGKPDLVVVNGGDGTIGIYRNLSTNGTLATASFASPVVLAVAAGANNVGRAVLADLDGDGRLDILIGGFNTSHISVFQNLSSPGSLGTNSFGAEVDIPAGNSPFAIAVADLDGDGNVDIVTANHQDNTVSVLRNIGSGGTISTGSFAAPVNFATGPAPWVVFIADLDGDGKPDVVSLNQSDPNHKISLLRNLGTGSISSNSFAPAVDLAGADPGEALTVGDVDGDGKLDLVAGSYVNGTFAVYRNASTPGSLGTNSFAPPVSFGVGARVHAVALGDLDGDGKPDLAVVTELPSGLDLYKNLSTPGSFTTASLGPQLNFASQNNASGVVIADLDGDGRSDVAFGNSYSASIEIYRNAIPPETAPVITQQPTNLTVNVSNTAMFAVTVTGTTPLHYQWSFNHTNLLGATNATLTLPNVQLAQAGSYAVMVTNLVGFTNSSAALLTVLNPTPPSCDAPPSGLVAWWPGQGNAFDFIGTNNGVAGGGVSFTNGLVGQAFNFQANDSVTISDSPSLDPTNAMTIEYWIYPRAAQPSHWTQSVVAKDNYCIGHRQYKLEIGDSLAHPGAGDFRAAIGVPAGFISIDGGTVVQTNTWYHVAQTYDGTNLTLYVNGAVDGQVAVSGPIVPVNEPVRLGGDPAGCGSQYFFNGLLDEPSFYNRALSSSEIAAIYQAGSAGKCTTPTETVLTMVATNAMSGTAVTMPVFMNALGTENTFLASVGYDPTKLVLNHVQLGKATAGAFLAEVDSQTNNGYVGFAVLLNIGATVPAGTQEVAEVVFQSVPTTNTTTVNLTFGDNPTTRQVVDTNLDLLPALYFGGSITLTPAEYEADVYPRFTGNHQVNVQDWLEVGRMVAGLDTPTNQDEFLRADCAPRNAPDGALTVADWVQAGRYALGLDPLTLVMPPKPPVLASQLTSQDDSSSGRILFISNVTAQRGQAVTVPVELVCTTNENAVGLTASYNPNQLQLTGVTLGSAMAGGRLNVNSNLLTGKLGLALALPPGATLPAGTNQVAVLQFIASTTASGNVVVALDDSTVTLQVADQLANALPTAYVNGAVVLPAQPTLGAAGMAGGLQLSWPASSGTFQIQTANNPAGPWTTVSLPIITNGANAAVTVSPTNQQQYFRLQGQ